MSPIRSKNKSLCPLFAANNQTSVNTSTPIIVKKISQSQQPQQQQQHKPINDHLIDTHNDRNKSCNFLTSSSIPYREKKNPLSSTRLSCYKPKISQTNNQLPHYKSVDDFMFLNAADDLTSNTDSTDSDYLSVTGGGTEIDHHQTTASTDMSSKLFYSRKKDHQPSVGGLQQSPELHQNQYQNHDDTYGFASLKTKSVDNLCDQIENDIIRRNSTEQSTTPSMSNKKKHQAAAYLSNRIRLMSNRTQKLFHRFYSQHTNSECSKPLVIGSPIILQPNQIPAHLLTSKSRRSLSYGHLPDIDDFQQNLKPFQEPREDHLICNIQKVASDTFGINADDTDSGILVNESGQSSIIETEDSIKIDHLSEKILAKHPNEYKFVRIQIHDDDRNRSLRLVLTQKQRYSENNKNRIGYQVTNILPGGLIDR